MKSNCCGKLSLKYIKYLPIVPGGIVSVCTRKISSDKPLVNLSLLEQVLAGPFSDEVCPSPCNDRFRSSTERSGATFRCTRLLLQRVGYSSSSDSPGEGMESSSATSSAGGVDKEETIVDWTTKPLPGDLPRRQLPPRRYHQTTDSNITHVSGKRKPSSPSADAGAASSVLEDLGSIEEIKLESRSKPLNLLSETERCRFIKAIVTEKLKELALRQGKDTAETTTKREEDEATLEALRYQAQLEIQWIEDWAWDHPLHLSFNSVEQPSDKDFPEDEIKQRRLLVKRALLELIDYQKPLPYIIGTHPFYGCVLHCRPPVICPQAETEMWTHWLIESLLKPVLLPAGGRGGTRILNATSLNGTDKTKQEESMITPIRVLDMCCGTGCVGIAMAKHLPECSVVGVDIDPRAVELASLNAVANGVPLNSLDDKGRYISIQGNMFAALHSDEGTRNGTFSVDQAAQDHRFGFDVLVCNPPYLFPEEYAALPVYDQYWLPKLAVLGDPEREGAQQYRYFQELCEVGWQMLRQKKDQHLALHGIPNFVVEVGQQAALVAGMMEKAVNRVTGASLWEDIELHLDFNQQPRWVSARSVH